MSNAQNKRSGISQIVLGRRVSEGSLKEAMEEDEAILKTVYRYLPS